jgi:hypothetical protein
LEATVADGLFALVALISMLISWGLSRWLFLGALATAAQHDVSITSQGEDLLEVYRQKYENFRHLDNLRWGTLTIAVAALGATLAYMAEKPGTTATGLLFLVLWMFESFCWWFLYRVTVNHRKNHFALVKAGSLIGDKSIPPQTEYLSSAAFWAMALLGAVAAVAATFAVWNLM